MMLMLIIMMLMLFNFIISDVVVAAVGAHLANDVMDLLCRLVLIFLWPDMLKL